MWEKTIKVYREKVYPLRCQGTKIEKALLGVGVAPACFFYLTRRMKTPELVVEIHKRTGLPLSYLNSSSGLHAVRSARARHIVKRRLWNPNRHPEGVGGIQSIPIWIYGGESYE